MATTGKQRGRKSAAAREAETLAAMSRRAPRAATKAPAHLAEAGRELFDRIVDQYAIGDAAGLALLAIAAECLDRVREAQALIKLHGPVVETGAGGLKTNPACKIETDARNGLLAALRGLNLDIPADIR